MKFKERILKIWQKYFTTASKVLIILFFLTLFGNILSNLFPAVAERIATTLGDYIRWIFSLISGILPFSISEILICLSPIAVGVVIYFGIKAFKNKVRLVRYTITVICVISLFYTLHFPTLGVGYKRSTIASRLDFGNEAVNSETLTATFEILKTECEARLDKIEFSSQGSSVGGKTLNEISSLVCDGYDVLCEDYPELNMGSFDSKAKPVLASKLMTSLELAGIYTYFTGEANINVHLPDYTIPFTVAHEFAHQRGYIRENEANFIAFLVCTSSSDPYVAYSGYYNMMEYILSAISKTDKELYRSCYESLDPRMRGELKAYSEFYKANKNELLGNISEFLNDKYLKSQGTEGVVSYGMVVKLCVAYYAEADGQ